MWVSRLKARDVIRNEFLIKNRYKSKPFKNIYIVIYAIFFSTKRKSSKPFHSIPNQK
jgi:hypothetical protein